MSPAPFALLEGHPVAPPDKNFCVVCAKPNCCTLQHGQWACSDACCEIIIRGENKKVRETKTGLLAAERKFPL